MNTVQLLPRHPAQSRGEDRQLAVPASDLGDARPELGKSSLPKA